MTHALLCTTREVELLVRLLALADTASGNEFARLVATEKDTLEDLAELNLCVVSLQIKTGKALWLDRWVEQGQRVPGAG